MHNSPRVYFVVSGEHPSLPLAELVATLQALRVHHQLASTEFKIVTVEAEPETAFKAAVRAGYTEEAGIEILQAKGFLHEITQAMKDFPLERYISTSDSFSVRVARFGGVSKGLPTALLERHLGALIVRKTGAKVDLRAPRKLFRGILAGPSFHLGLATYQRPRGSIAGRRPRKRPAFHPSTMVPKLARCMVNLAQPKENDRFLDPFCGVGGILLEACLIGCQSIGLDAVARMVRGARRNLAHFGVRPIGLLRGDARHIPLREVDAIATDPPYGTGASTLKSTTRRILENFLPEARTVLAKGNRAVVASPLGTGASMIAENSDFTVLDRHYVYVHRSLTREILVLRAD